MSLIVESIGNYLVTEGYAKRLLGSLGNPSHFVSLAMKVGPEAVLDEVRPLMKKLGLKTKIVFDSDTKAPLRLPYGNFGQYVVNRDLIVINSEYFVGDHKMPKSIATSLITTIYHELVHAYQHKVMSTENIRYNSNTDSVMFLMGGSAFGGVERSAYAFHTAIDWFLSGYSLSDFDKRVVESKKIGERVAKQVNLDKLSSMLDMYAKDSEVFKDDDAMKKVFKSIIIDDGNKIKRLMGITEIDFSESRFNDYFWSLAVVFYYKGIIKDVESLCDKMIEIMDSLGDDDNWGPLNTLNSYLNGVVRSGSIIEDALNKALKMFKKYFRQLDKFNV